MILNGLKTCTKCKRRLAVSAFPSRGAEKDRKPGGLSSHCRKCRNARLRRYWRANASKYDTKEGRAKKRTKMELPEVRFKLASKSAKKRGISWDLTFDQWFALVCNEPCHYCGGPLPKTGSSLDRKDSDGHYTPDNVVPCCGECNRLKNNILSYSEMVSVIQLLKSMRKQPLIHIVAPLLTPVR